MNIHIYYHSDPTVVSKLDRIIRLLRREVVVIMANLDMLTQQVAENTSVEASAIELLQGLSEKLTAAATDPVALQALIDEMNNSADALAEAITSNTPVE